MKILHYALGFPPYRTGGMIKFAFDLMCFQVEQGHDVLLLWPGKMQGIGKDAFIKKRPVEKGIKSYELINPLPVPLDEGIADIDAFTSPVDIKIFSSFLEGERPDVIHVHTLMGLPKEFITAANALNIRTIFTTHDYFGICPKVTMYRNGTVCEDVNCEHCDTCNKSALSIRKIQIMQSNLYRYMKDSAPVRFMRKKHRAHYFEQNEQVIDDMKMDVHQDERYLQLRRYYVDMIEHMDCIHFNSFLAKQVYEKYVTPKSTKVISITHRDIQNHITKRKVGEAVHFLYLGPPKPFKGFQLMLNVFDQLNVACPGKFELHIYVDDNFGRAYIHQHKPYQYNDLPEIMSQADVLISPSIWYETFGFTILEALSFGVPVIVSSHVGAKDIVDKTNGWIYDWDKPEELEKILQQVISDHFLIEEKNVREEGLVDFETMVQKIYSM